jgi:N-acetyl-anhydromuramyl-L-alanine amidase AmpD
MLYIDKAGYVDSDLIEKNIFGNLEHGTMSKVNGIVVHQTFTDDTKTVFNSYRTPSANGAHFLIGKEGKIYQTASVRRITYHVGRLKSRCIETRICSETELKHVLSLESITSTSKRSSAVHRNEIRKTFPHRYPGNPDSIGIELVGNAFGPKGREIYEAVTDLQNAALRWLINELTTTLGVSMQEIYRHPKVSRKNKTEASTAQW